MAEPFGGLRRFLRELKRRNVYRVAVTYAVVGFVLVQVADLTFVRLGLPSWTVTFVIVLVAHRWQRRGRAGEPVSPSATTGRGRCRSAPGGGGRPPPG